MDSIDNAKPYKDKVLFQVTDEVIDLRIGAPGPDLLAKSRDMFRIGANERLASSSSSDDLELFQYGVMEGPTSYLYNLAKFLSTGYEDKVDMEDLILTSGASSGLSLAASVLLDPDCVLFVESPTYFLVLNMLKDLGLTKNTVPIPMEADGLDLQYLESKVKGLHSMAGRTDKDGRYWALLYTIPTYHNPTGVCLSDVKAIGLVHLARQYDFLVICDDVYNLLHYHTTNGKATPPRRLFSYDRDCPINSSQGHVISNGSFSKILAPGMRLGWIETSPEIKAKILKSGVLDSGGSMNAVTAGIASMIMELGLQADHVATLRRTYKERMDTVVEILQEGLPDAFEIPNPKGGYFVWVKGSKDFDATKFAEFCGAQINGVKFLPGKRCSSMDRHSVRDGIPPSPDLETKMSCKNCFRISIGYYTKPVLQSACATICQAYNRFSTRRLQ